MIELFGKYELFICHFATFADSNQLALIKVILSLK